MVLIVGEINSLRRAKKARAMLRSMLVIIATCMRVSAVFGQSVSGTGFFISPDGFIATNNHVIAGLNYIVVRSNGGEEYDAEVVRTDVANDIAILRVDGYTFHTLPIRPSSTVRKGESVFTIGFPNVNIQGVESKITQGVVSSLSGIGGEPNSFQISVALQPGNSGGPLLDSKGFLVGIASAKLNPSATFARNGTLPESVNYAVKSNYLLELIATIPGLAAKLTKPQKTTAKTLAVLVAKAEKSVVFIQGGQVMFPKARHYELNDNSHKKPIVPQSPTNPKRSATQITVSNYNIAMDLFNKKDYQEAFKIFDSCARDGYAPAQYMLGEMYGDGLGVTPNDTDSFKWYLKSAQLGFASAQYAVANMYWNSRGVSRDDDEAVRWFRLAAEQGHVGAIAALTRLGKI